MSMKKKGVAISAMVWMIAAVVLMVIVLVIVWTSKGRLTGIVELVKSIVRFGG
jgi:hypothetical protein